MRIERQRHGWLLTQEQWLPAPTDLVFEFFADAENLERITPPWLRFGIVTSVPIAMRAGTLIDYRLRLHGIPFRWRTEIHHWDPPHAFVDRQLRGPYRKWIHTHTFEAVDGGTLCRDRVEYDVPFGLIPHELMVRRDLHRIFEYRRQRLAEAFPVTHLASETST